jgi:alkylhydroperoxidase family enzyme
MIPARMASSVVQRQIRYVRPVPVAAGTGLVARVYDHVQADMRLVVPPALLHSPVPELLAAYWVLMREGVVATGVADREAKEAVATAVSVANVCPYCVDMHSVSMYTLADEADAEAIAGDRAGEVRDPSLRQVAEWARTAHQLDSPAVLPASVSPAQRAELIGAVVALEYLTRMVNVFLPNYLVPPGLGPRARRRFKQAASVFMRQTLHEAREPGQSLDLLPAAAVPAGEEWAIPAPAVAQAVARSYAVFEAAGARSLSPEVRGLVLGRLGEWRGEQTGLSTAWCEKLLTGLSPADRAAGRLAMLTVFASYRITEDLVAEFRRHHPADSALLEVTGWASFAAASLIGRRQGEAAHRAR